MIFLFFFYFFLEFASFIRPLRPVSILMMFILIGCGRRQGCPLSPLLFAMAIEPLSITLSSSPLFKGIIRNGIEYKLSLYADDLLLYITDPTLSIPADLSILENFSTFSGYKLNLAKSECFPINTAARHIQQSDFPFQFSPSGFKYLISLPLSQRLHPVFKDGVSSPFH